MNIDLIIEVLKMGYDAIVARKYRLDPTVYAEQILFIEQALTEARKMKPTTITADPATWPPVDVEVLLYEDGNPFVSSMTAGGEVWHDGGIDITVCDCWQYLPEWEG